MPYSSTIGAYCRSDHGLNESRYASQMKETYMEKPVTHAAGCKPLTTFVQTDTNTFREVVQRLTGASETSVAQEGEATKVISVKRPKPKLHERRQYTRPKLEINEPSFQFKPGTSPKHHPCFPPSKSGNSSILPGLELSSPISGNSSHLPSPLTPSTIFSKLSILDEGKKGELARPVLNSQEEDKAIKERRFYLHPLPQSRPEYTEPELLTLFPLTSLK
ncbi:putative VQ motif-containing protein [Quillaja saponaria]|uniref:VQ motif-containing protein n=1 Tax=Quillaja saponaria TaxID=32244 RepID=A0AAD7PJK7_QUISA|nr:putative VQ motif-containing protein [Quillaja saponaria]